MTLQIINLQAENYKRIKAVNITPSGNLVFIGGKNAQGKTSVLDAIWAALAGGEASRATNQPIRDGQETAVVTLDLGDYIVTRRWTKDDAGTLTVESPDGAKYSSPQKVLDAIVGQRSFDPLAFVKQSARDQVATLVSTVKLPFDPDQLARERKGIFDQRTEEKRAADLLKGQLAGYPTPNPETPAEEISGATIIAEYEAATAHNAAIDRQLDTLAAAQSRSEAADAEVERIAEALEVAKLLALDKRKTYDQLVAEFKSTERLDVDSISARLSTVEQTNAAIRAAAERRAIDTRHKAKREDIAQLTIALERIDERKADALAAVKFPVDGLSFDDTGVLYNNIPFSQASAAEQLRVSVALAMALNPTLRVLRILDGSLLDSNSLALIEGLAQEHEYQVWIEVVSDDSSRGVIIEDGEVAS